MKGRNGILIAAPQSGSGKTLITCALMQALLNHQHAVCSFKCGPDYIDPMFHREILSISGGNLDSFFTSEEETRKLFFQGTRPEDFAVVEGVMGLYDGIGAKQEAGSSYHLAAILDLPIILVVDAHGMGRSLLPLIYGFLSYDHLKQIRGIILNRVSESYFPVLKEVVEQKFDIEVFGFFPQQKNLHLESRHLGLKRPEEIQDIKKQLREAAKQLEKYVDIESVYKAGCEQVKQAPDVYRIPKEDPMCPVLAVARDEAFCFYYQENLRMLADAGFQIVEFSPIHDHKLPENTEAILLGGGYPELYADVLAANRQMRKEIFQAISRGIPSLAECGGFMYLHETLITQEGISYPMVGILKGTCENQGKLVRFGYVSIRENKSYFLPEGEEIRGHEFHYYDSVNNGNDCIAKKPLGDRSWNCILAGQNHWWGFPHLYYPSNPAFVTHFREAVLANKKLQNGD